jgi:hypothetical protein
MLMDYLVSRLDNEEAGCTPFHLATRVPKLRTQRQERIQMILTRFEANGFVKATHSDRMTIFEATIVGATWYRETARKFYEPFGLRFGEEGA